MPQFALRQPVEIEVTAERGFVVEIWQLDLTPTRYKVLHVENGNRRTTWLPETELKPLPPGEVPPFPDPFISTSESN